MIDEIKIGSLVITSRSRYGTVINIKNEYGIDKVLVRIGSKEYWMFKDQIRLAANSVVFKVYYSFKYCDKLIETSDEIAIEKGTILFDSTSYDNKSLINIISDKLCKKINQVVKITKILIS